MVAFVSLFSIIESHYSSIDPALVGLALAYALPITSGLQGFITSFTDTEREVVSIERCLEYMELPPEEPEQMEMMKIELMNSSEVGEDERSVGIVDQDIWPRRGDIEVKNLTMRYRPGLPPAIENLSLRIFSGQHVGIVGMCVVCACD